MLNKKYNCLKENISKLKSVIVAFSGGVDSSFLLYTASTILGKKNVLAVTADSPTYTKTELKEARQFAKKLGIKRLVIKTDEFKNPDFVKNPINRCYHCKKELFSELKKIAHKQGYNFVLDGQNADDVSDFRPGSLASRELGVKSPLKEVGLTKKDIRRLSKKLGLATWDKSALACLSSRFPYGNKIFEKALRRIQQAEQFLHQLRFKEVRVRHYDKLCRIEVQKDEVKKLFSKTVREKIIAKFKKLGYTYITVDLEGYRMGSMNEVLNKKSNIKY